MSYRHLLFPLAPKQALGSAFHQALQFANQEKANVTLLTVIEELAEMQDLSRYSVSTLSLLDKATRQCEKQLEEYISILTPQYPNIMFDIKVATGIPYIEIIKAAASNSADLIVIDAHRDHKETACQGGTSTRHLMRESSIPIWAIQPQLEPARIKKIVAAIDVTDADSAQLNEKILQYAHEFAEINRSSLYPCHAWRLESEGYLREWNRCTDLEIAVIAKQLRDDRSARLEALVMPYSHSSTSVQITMLEGNAKKILPDFVNNNDIDLVVMGSVSRTGIAGFVMGNTAEYMLDKIQCSVLTLKPEEFKSPVLG